MVLFHAPGVCSALEIDASKRLITKRSDAPRLVDIGNPAVYPGGKNTYKSGWNTLPPMDGATIDTKTFKVGDQGAFMTTYITKNYDPKKIKRVVIQVHGVYRDAWNQWMYANMSAANATHYSDFTMDEVLIVAPMFFSVGDAGAFPTDASNRSTTATMVWNTNDWGNTDDAVYPSFTGSGKLDNPNYTVAQAKKSDTAAISGLVKETYSDERLDKHPLLHITKAGARRDGPQLGTMDAFDMYINYFTNKAMFPNVNKIVLAGFSMGGQAVSRYVTFRVNTEQDSMVNYWVSSPASFVYLNDTRPAPTDTCPKFNEYKYGLEGRLPGYVNRTSSQNTPEIIRNRFLSRKVYYFVGTEDSATGDPSCSAKTQGEGHSDRMDLWVKGVLPYLPNNPRPGQLPLSVSYAQIEGVPHLASGIILSSAGMQSLFADDFYGPGKNAPGLDVLKPGTPQVLAPSQGLPDAQKSPRTKSAAAALAPPATPLVALAVLSCIYVACGVLL